MEVGSRQVYSAQGDRRTAFQLPVSKNIVPTTLRQPEASNNGIDSYFGVGKVRASSANPSRRTIAATRSSILDTTHNNSFGMSNKGYYVPDESPRINGNNIQQLQQQQQQQQLQQHQMLMSKQQANYDQMRANSQKMSFLSDMIATKPPSGAAPRNISSAGGMGSPSPRSLQQYQPLPPGSMVALTGSNNFRGSSNGSNTANYHLMANNNSNQINSRVSANMDNINAQLSSSMPLSLSRTAMSQFGGGGGVSAGGSETDSLQSDVVSILSTSSASRKNTALREKGVVVKKRVKFSERIATFACVSDFDAVNGFVTPLPASAKPRPSSAAATLMTAPSVTVTSKFSPITSTSSSTGSGSAILANISLYLSTGAGAGTGAVAPTASASIVSASSPLTAPAPVAFTANLSNGTITYSAVESSVAPVTDQRPPISSAAVNSLQTVHNTLNNQQTPARSSSAVNSSAKSVVCATPAESLPSISGKKAGASAPGPSLLLPMPGMAADLHPATQSSSATSVSNEIGTPSLGTVAQVTPAASALPPPVNVVPTIAPSSSGSAKSSGPAPRKKPTRPSLSEQLASIGAKAEALTSDIRIKGKLEAVNGIGSGDSALHSMPARCFSIGSLSCRFPSPVHFYSDRCEYVFNHPFESSVINMVIYYRDMSAISILGTKFKFKLPKRLACFSTDFDPQNPHHVICVELSSMLSVSVVREKVLPMISTFK